MCYVLCGSHSPLPLWLNLVFDTFFHIVAGYSSDPPAFKLTDSPHSITLGETSMLQCNVIVEGLNVHSAWHLKGKDFNFIDEDPLLPCNRVCMYYHAKV